MITRRSFLKLIAAAPLLPLLPLPAEPSGFAPYVQASCGHLTIADINAVTLQVLLPAVTDNFFRETPMLEYFRRQGVVRR